MSIYLTWFLSTAVEDQTVDTVVYVSHTDKLYYNKTWFESLTHEGKVAIAEHEYRHFLMSIGGQGYED